MFSLEASGTIGGVITAAKWKGRPYFRTKVTPSNPRSQAQYRQRAMMAFLSQRWKTFHPAVQALWEPLAQAGSYSRFNAFVQFNLARWSRTEMVLDRPVVESPVSVGSGAQIEVVPGVKSCTFSTSMTMADQPEFALISISTVTGETALTQSVRVILPTDASGTCTGQIVGLVSGTTYYLTSNIANWSGEATGASGAESVVIG